MNLKLCMEGNHVLVVAGVDKQDAARVMQDIKEQRSRWITINGVHSVRTSSVVLMELKP